MLAFDPNDIKPYTPSSLPEVLTFVGDINRESHWCVSLHPGDVAHYLTNGLRGREATAHVYVYRDAGAVRAVMINYVPKASAIDVLVRADQRGTLFEDHLWMWIETAARATLGATDAKPAAIESDVLSCDVMRQKLLTSRGYTAGTTPHSQVTMRPLTDEIPSPQLPPGFSLRAVSGEHEAGAVGEMHASAFGSRWEPGDYLRVMRTPGSDFTRELVAVAPDGHLAAFLVYWLDPISRCGLFEPVGCHAAFQRRGLARALMYTGMRRMHEHGMTMAMVVHHLRPAPGGLYAAVGFTPLATVSSYRKAL